MSLRRFLKIRSVYYKEKRPQHQGPSTKPWGTPVGRDGVRMYVLHITHGGNNQ